MGPRTWDDVRSDLGAVARQHGTPAYVVDVESLNRAAAEIESAFPRPWLWQYSLKANDLPAVVAAIAARGWGANVVSSGEWQQSQAAGVSASQTTLEGIGKTDRDLRAVISAALAGEPLRWLSVESGAELQRLSELLGALPAQSALSLRIDVLTRLNPQVQPETVPGLAVGRPSSKFGMDADEVRSLVGSSELHPAIRLKGVHVHIGSNLGDVTAWARAGRLAVELLEELRSTWPGADTVDFGGGFPAFGRQPTPRDFHVALAAELAGAGLSLPPVCAIEPGRSLVGTAGWLVGSVLHSRVREPYEQQVVLDTGMTELIRPALYGSHHTVRALVADGHLTAATELLKTAVEGPICESTDSFGIHDLPELVRGDLVAVGEAGAYGASFTSRYNGRPQPPEALLWPDGTVEVGQRTELVTPTPASPGSSDTFDSHAQPERSHS